MLDQKIAAVTSHNRTDDPARGGIADPQQSDRAFQTFQLLDAVVLLCTPNATSR
jgi:hypothetical protein